jgi:hypothetical protein
MTKVVDFPVEKMYPRNPKIKDLYWKVPEPSDEMVWALCPYFKEERCLHCVKQNHDTEYGGGESARQCYWKAHCAARTAIATLELERLEKLKE